MKALIWWEFSATDDQTMLINPAKNTENRRTTFRSGASVWCQPNTLGYEWESSFFSRSKRKSACV